MFDATSFDFGTVARGAKVEHRFTIENVYEEDMVISSVSSSCGCTEPRIDKRRLKKFEKAELVAAIDTTGHLGRKDATVTVTFAPPFSAEVQIHVHVYIRSDIVVQPGEVQFGSVRQGAGAKQRVSVTYAGRGDWRIERVESANPSIEARAVETGRTPQLISYDLAVTLKEDAPPGYIRDQLVLVTNDRDARAARVPVVVEGVVLAGLIARPSPLSFGVVEAGQSLTKTLVIQGKAPFRITGVQISDERFQCKLPEEAKAVHVLPVTFAAKDAKAAAGPVNAKLHVETDLNGTQGVDVQISAQVSPPRANP